MSRSAKSLLLEAELMLSSAERVAAFYEANAAERNLGKKFHELIDEDVEKSLLGRKDPLVDLTIAKYTQNKSSSIYLMKTKSRPIRLAVLSNRYLADRLLWLGFPNQQLSCVEHSAFSPNSADSTELEALFQNPSLDPYFLESVLRQKPPWDGMADERFREIVINIGRCQRVWSDGIEWPSSLGGTSSTWLFLRVAHDLALTAPVTDGWAGALRELLCQSASSLFQRILWRRCVAPMEGAGSSQRRRKRSDGDKNGIFG